MLGILFAAQERGGICFANRRIPSIPKPIPGHTGNSTMWNSVDTEIESRICWEFCLPAQERGRHFAFAKPQNSVNTEMNPGYAGNSVCGPRAGRICFRKTAEFRRAEIRSEYTGVLFASQTQGDGCIENARQEHEAGPIKKAPVPLVETGALL
jgi:hypothetical protein